MPKKYHNKTLYTKPASSAPTTLSPSTTAPSHHGRSATASGSQPSPSSVNELISHLRQTQVSDEHQTPRISTAAPVHPSLRNILDVPDLLSPRPRPGMVRSSGPTRTRRIPGPPPPASWLAASWHAPKRALREALDAAFTSRRVKQSSNLPGAQFPLERTLQHTVMKAMASNWSWHLEYDNLYLATELSTRTKEILLSYIAIYGNEGSVRGLRILFPKSGDNTTEDSVRDLSEVKRLDLANAIGSQSTMKRVSKELLLMHSAEVSNQAKNASDVVPDSWDSEDDVNASDVTGQLSQEPLMPTGGWALHIVSPSFKVLRFPNLIHLSLAITQTTRASLMNQSMAATWSDLLEVTSYMPKLSTLSLAYWPRPTLTPVAAMTYSTIKNPVSGSLPGVSYGGSDMYSSYDGDWTEAANILKRLSRHLYCLHWLDLTGCDWHGALMKAGPEWNGAWRQLGHIGLGPGWLPEVPEGLVEAAHQEPALADGWDAEAIHALKKHRYDEAVRYYQELQETAKDVARHLRRIRTQERGKWIDFDFGP